MLDQILESIEEESRRVTHDETLEYIVSMSDRMEHCWEQGELYTEWQIVL
jgi:hypothetical protein